MKNITLKEARFEFAEWGSAVYAPRTVDTYVGLLDRFIRHVGDKDVVDVSISEIASYIAHLKKRGYAEASVAYMVISVRVFFRYMYETRRIKWDYRIIKVPRYITKHFPTIKEQEAKEMEDRVSKEDFAGLRDLVTLRLLYDTGMRNSELCDLRIDQIDVHEMYAKIYTKKSKKFRIVPWSPDTNELLIKYLDQRELIAYDDKVIVSVSANYYGRGVGSRTVQRIVEKYRKPGSRTVPHSYRSFHLTKLLENGTDLETVRQSAGHSSIISTQPYLRLSDKFIVQKVRAGRGWKTKQKS